MFTFSPQKNDGGPNLTLNLFQMFHLFHLLGKQKHQQMCFCLLGLSKAAKKKPRLSGKNLPKLVATDWISLTAAVVGSCLRSTTTFRTYTPQN